MKTKTKLIISIIFVLLFIILPIKPLWLGIILSGISGFSTGWLLVEVIKEKMQENENR